MIGVYVLTVILLSVSSGLVSSQYVPPSPCPDIFSYKREGQQVHGVIRYQPAGQMIHVFMRASFAIATHMISFSVSPNINDIRKIWHSPIERVNHTYTRYALLSHENRRMNGVYLLMRQGYAGQLEVEGSKELALLKMLRGHALDYRLDFPLTDPLPRLVNITVNGHAICTGDSDNSGLSQFTLEHLLYDKGDGLNPIAVNFGNSENNRPLSNISPKPTQLYRPTDAECGVVSGGNDQVGLVYYGTAVSPGDWPWLVAIFTRLRDNIQYICGGSLVSSQHVITAGHCMSRKDIVRPLRDFVLKLGAFNLDFTDDPRVSRRGVKAAALHTHYDSDTLANDALILQLDEPVVYTKYIRPICLWEGRVDLNIIVRKYGSVVGWGGNEKRESGTGEPRVATMPIVSTRECRASRIEFHKLTNSNNTLCGGYRNGTGPCNGDSGSGLYMFAEGRWRLRGVVSVSLRPVTGEAKCNLDEYVVFTDIAQYLPWLQQHLQGQSDRSQISQLPTAPTPTSASEPECGVVSGGNEQVERIYQGTSAAPGEWPWLVALFRREYEYYGLQFICGGNIISNQHVITTAHCTRYSPSPTKYLLVRAGVLDLNSFSEDNVVTRGIQNVILHPGYILTMQARTYRNNIAILKLDKAISFTAYIRPVCLWDKDSDVNMVFGKHGTVTGWGFIRNGGITGHAPRVTSLPIVSSESCIRSKAKFVEFVTPNTFCAGNQNGTSPCNEDSGGGLYMLREGRWRLRGIISLTFCNQKDYTVFTDVAQYLPWLKQNLYDS